MNQGVKESEGKLEYEFDWSFIDAMAQRMQLNKGKYEPYNWQKPMDVDKLKQALFRHTISVMKGIYNDTNELDHLPAIADNAMMIWYQLKNNQDKEIVQKSFEVMSVRNTRKKRRNKRLLLV